MNPGKGVGGSGPLVAGMLMALLISLTLNALQQQHHQLTQKALISYIPTDPAAAAAASAAAAAAASAAATTAATQQQPEAKQPVKPEEDGKWCRPYHIEPPRDRGFLPVMCQQMGYKTGVELGVQQGYFARHHLATWPSCTKYYLVDIWKTQENYKDLANVPQDTQEKYLEDTRNNVKDWPDKVVFVRNYTTDAAKVIPDNLDYIYVDARHDYCGVTEDLNTYWPKLRQGGMMAGHDYIDNGEVKQVTPHQDWSICADGTVREGAVRQAVNDFAKKHGLPVVATTHDGPWRSWVIMKPYCKGGEP